MKKTFIFGLMAAALGFTACSSEDDAILTENTQKGMVLNATVAQPADTRATIDDTDASAWAFHFAEGDDVMVKPYNATTYYKFTKDATNFKSSDATPTATATKWYAYYPQAIVDLADQTGQLTGEGNSVATLYALAGATTKNVTGETSLSINMQPQVAIIKIVNNKGNIDIKVKSLDSYLTGLQAEDNGDRFNVTANSTPNSFLTATTTGTYYIVVPASFSFTILDGTTVLKSTTGLTAGKYYELTVNAAPAFGTGTAKRTGDIDVKWLQLWENGPKFAEYNVGVTDGKAESYGGYYCWGSSIDKDSNAEYKSVSSDLTDDEDAATKLWGSAWRMPTQAELEALLVNCTVELTTVNGVNGCKFTGKNDYASNSVFLPAASMCDHGSVIPPLVVKSGFYWSSTPNTINNDNAYSLGFSLNMSNYQVSHGERKMGYSVRAVMAE